MASVRCRNGRWYYRITVSKAGKKKYIERGGFDTREAAIEASRSLNTALVVYEGENGLHNYQNFVNEAFRRFPEGHPYYIPLLLGYKYAMGIDDVFNLEIQDVNMQEHKLKELYLDEEDWKVLVRHVKKINQCASALNYKHYNKNYLNVRLKDGSYISPTCIHYISRVFRGKEGNMRYIDPKWSWRKWCSRENLIA